MPRFRRMVACLVVHAALAQGISFAAESTTAFDGSWDVVLTCPPHNEEDDAKGYVHRFPAEITGGIVRGTYGREGEPGWHLLTGTVEPGGNAALRLEGVVSNPDYAINKAQRGKAYAYRVRASFEQAKGSGQRVGRRKCDFQFNRR